MQSTQVFNIKNENLCAVFENSHFTWITSNSCKIEMNSMTIFAYEQGSMIETNKEVLFIYAAKESE